MSEGLPSTTNNRLALATFTGLIVGGGLTLLLQRLYNDYAVTTPLLQPKDTMFSHNDEGILAAVTKWRSNTSDTALDNQNAREIVDRIVILQTEVQVLTENISTLVKNQALKRGCKEISEEEFQDPLAQRILVQHTSRHSAQEKTILVSPQKCISNDDANEIYYDPPDTINKQDEDNRKLLTFYNEIDVLLNGNDVDKAIAYKKLLQKEKTLKCHVNFLWRISRACFLESVVAKLKGRYDKQKKLLFTAKDYAFTALKMDSQNCEVHKWCAITIGSIAQFESINTRIQHGYKFKEHIDIAIELCPNDPTSQHLKGRWCYEVSQLSWVERKAAAAMFSAPPTSTIEDALDCFIASEKLKPTGSIDNQMFLGKCYLEKRDAKNGLKWLKKARALKAKGHEEEQFHEEIDKLLYKWS